MSVKQPLISIIVSTLNDGERLATTINSVCSQDYIKKELIIIDGNSSDSTKEILKRYKHKINFYLSEDDNGIYHAWNKGISNSKGKWISFLGAGDRYYRENSLSSLLGSINNQEINFASGIIYLENKHNAYIGSLGKQWNPHSLKNNINIGHPGSLHHRSLFDKHGDFNINYKICGDYEFLLRAKNSIFASFYPNYLVKMDNIGVSNQKPYSAILESTKAIYANNDFGVYLSFRYFIRSMVKSTIKKMLLKFSVGKKLLRIFKEKDYD